MFVCNWHQARATSYIFVCLRLLPSKFTNLGFYAASFTIQSPRVGKQWTALNMSRANWFPESSIFLKALLANSCQCPLLSLSCQLVYQSWRALKDYRFWNIVTWIVALSEFHQHCTLHFGLSIRWLRLVIWLSGAWVRKLHISTSNTWHLTSNRHPNQLWTQAEIHVTFCIWSLVPSDIFDIHTWMENKSGKQSRTILIYFGTVK